MKTGKLPENVLKRSVLRQINTRSEAVQSGAGIGKDCAILAFPKTTGMAVCMQEGPVSVNGEAAEEPAAPEPAIAIGNLIQRCANNLAAGGTRPLAVMVTLLLPRTAQEADVKGLMAQAEAKCKELSMEIAGGQTRVTGGVSLPFGVITGFGRPWGHDREENCPGRKRSEDAGGRDSGTPERYMEKPGERHGNHETGESAGGLSGGPVPGQDVVLSKWIGLEGTALLAKGSRERLLERYPAYLVEEAETFDRYLSVLPEAETAVRFGVSAMHDASAGGIFGALWELAEGAGVGLSIDMRKLPLRQETVEVCECCNVNPYELLAGGCLVMVTEDGPGLAAALEREHIPAALVGKITDSNDRILINGDEIRYMDRPKRDGILEWGDLNGFIPQNMR